MKVGKLFVLTMFVGMWTACSDDNGRDDTVLDMEMVTGKYWYCTHWANNPNSYTTDDLIEVVKLEDNGKLWGMDFGGRTDEQVGMWSNTDNEIILSYNDGTVEKWGVLHSGSNYLEVMVNKGERKYVTEPNYLKEITGDAFLVNEVKSTGNEPTRIGIAIRGKNTVNIGEASVIPATDKVFKLTYQSRIKVWSDKEDIQAADFGLPESTRDILFYMKVAGNPVKFKDRVYAKNLPQRSFLDFALNAFNTGKDLHVEWKGYEDPTVYYRIEILKENQDAASPYFVSQLYAGISSLVVNSNTKTETDVENRVGDLRNGDKYVVRLSAVLLEPGIDYNHNYSYANLQALTYVQRTLVWEEE